ncbi:hypothetical protein E0D81_17310 [Lelliottia amnigena]|nr:hypothetical protein E0D81_17310 [Lelliottia amnigena]
MQAMPSPRVPARRPGLTETLRRFSAGPEHRFNVFTSLCLFPAARKMMHFIPVSYVKKQRSFSFDLMPPFRQFQTVLHISSIFSRRCVTKLVSFPEVFRMRTYNDERQ